MLSPWRGTSTSYRSAQKVRAAARRRWVVRAAPNVLFIIHYLRMRSSKNDSENWSGQNRTSRTATAMACCCGRGEVRVPAIPLRRKCVWRIRARRRQVIRAFPTCYSLFIICACAVSKLTVGRTSRTACYRHAKYCNVNVLHCTVRRDTACICSSPDTSLLLWKWSGFQD